MEEIANEREGERSSLLTACRQDISLHEAAIKLGFLPAGDPWGKQGVDTFRGQQHANNLWIHCGFKAL
jgi:hypothetical protein